MKQFYLATILLLFLITSTTSFGQNTLVNGDYRTKTFNVTWSNPAHWQVRSGGTWITASTPPSATNNVYIQATHYVTLTANAACRDLHINNDATDPSLDLATYTLSVNGKIRAFTASATITSADGNLPGANTSPSTLSNWIGSTTGKIMVVGGTRTLFNTGEWAASNVGTPPASGNGFDLEINLTNATDTVLGQAPFKTRNLTITNGVLNMGTSWISVDQNAAGLGLITVNGTLMSANTGASSPILSRTNTTRSGTLTIGSTGVVVLSGTDPRIDVNSIVNNGRIVYGGAAQTLLRPTGSDASAATFTTYKNLTLSGTGIKTLGTNTTVNGSFTKGESASFAPGAFTLSYGGSSTLEYAGNAVQTTGAEFPTSGVPTLQINNPSGVLLNGQHTISGNLSLASGVLTTSNGNLLTLGDNATATGASDASYVDGPILKVGDDAFTFPIGKGGKYRPASISAPANTSDAFTAEYFHTTPPQGGSAALGSSGLHNVSQVEYWDITQSAGSSLPDITLSWNAQSAVNAGLLSDLRIAHYNGSSWDNLGNSATSGTIASGSITAPTSSLTSFSPFTLATVAANQPLPLHLLAFTANLQNNNVRLEWTTTCEDKMQQFCVERYDFKTFNIIGTLLAHNSGCGNNASYSFIDAEVPTGTIGYRLKMIDIAGLAGYSNTVEVKNTQVAGSLHISTNPVSKMMVISGLHNGDKYCILDVSGRLIINGTASGNVEVIHTEELPNGLYFIRTVNNRVLKFVKQ